ncbi:MAG: addiction module protein [Phycisphaerales bacterium]|nr:addiction module protein [Phycisphaerales bacterium]
MDEKLLKTLLALPVRERVVAAGEIWDSLADEDVPTSKSVLKKMQTRLDRYRRDPSSAMTLEEFKRKTSQLIKSPPRKDRKTA